jgi:iron complex transport system permease protein
VSAGTPASNRALAPGPGQPALLAIWAASAAVLGGALLSSFRLGFADDVPTLLLVNGPRVALGGAAGAALALAGAVRLEKPGDRPLRELSVLGFSTGAAGGGFLLASLAPPGAAAIALFGLGALSGTAIFLGAVRALDRPRRWTNLGVAVAIGAMAATAAAAGSFARARGDAVAPVVAWLLGDLSGARFTSGVALLLLVGVLLGLSLRALGPGRDDGRLRSLSLLSLGVGVGAAGPLAFIGGMVPRAVRALAAPAPRALVVTSAAAGAATVVAIDAVPRLLVGGYDFPWNLPAALLAIPIFLGWNRLRLRREAGRAPLPFEIAELAVIGIATLVAAALAVFLTLVVRGAT